MKELMLLAMLGTSVSGHTQGFTFRELQQKKKVEVMYNDKLVAAYCYWDSTEKPVLYPIKTLSGTTVTRGYPIAPRTGERTDHPHQVGMWLNYESVNGLDFWNNSFAIPAEKKNVYGSIRHQGFLPMVAEKDQAILRANSNWVDSKNTVILEEMTEFIFRVSNGDLIIDRSSVLKAKQPTVVFKDVKDGLLGLRVARELEMPSQQADTFVDANGVATKVPAMNNTGVTGQYINHEGITGDAVWGKRSVWTCLNGQRGGEHISIAIIDHPENPGAPTYWHARGYGLFAANPLGKKIFTDGKEEFNYAMTKDQTAKFRFRIVIHSGASYLGGEDINSLMKEFTNPIIR
jgi:hypothetical protein